MTRAAAGAALFVALALAVAGCSSGTPIQSDSAVTVYVSMPLRGSSGPDGRDVADAARLALAQAGGKAGGLTVRAKYLDDTRGRGSGARWSAAQVGANARRATEDSTSIAYIGDFESGATRTSEPITNEARLLQVSPASSAVELTRPFAGSEQLPAYEQAANERTFGRVIPDDDAQGRAAAAWLRGLHVGSVTVQGDGSAYSRDVASGFKEALGPIKLSPTAKWTFFTGDAPSAAAFRRRRDRGERILGTDAVIPPWSAGVDSGVGLATSAAIDPGQLPAKGRLFVHDFRSRYGRQPGRYAAYGYEAMAVVLDSIDRAASDTISRQGVIDEFFNTLDRNSILGTYSIDSVGNTTLDRMTGYRLEGGRLVPVAGLRSR